MSSILLKLICIELVKNTKRFYKILEKNSKKGENKFRWTIYLDLNMLDQASAAGQYA